MCIREVLVMKGKKNFVALSLLFIIVLTSACTSKDSSNTSKIKELEMKLKEKDTEISRLEEEIQDIKKPTEDEEVNGDEYLLNNLINVLKSLKSGDISGLQNYIHPEKGIRFTPYPYVDKEKDIVLKKDEIVDVFNDPKTYIWGNYDGRGNPIELSFKDYYKEFIYDEDFSNPQIIGNNYIVSSGNSLDNIREAYPDARFVELYFETFEELPDKAVDLKGMDWKSLKLVFEEYEGKWYLVGIIHGQWTI